MQDLSYRDYYAMIVNLQENGWEIIYHQAHALLAAQLAGNWNRKKTPQRIYETVAAISHHDDLEKEWEGHQLTPAGAPLDFTLEHETSVEKLRRHVEESLYRGRWVALLISMHLCFLSQGMRDQDPEIAAFLDEQETLQAQWREELELSKEEAQSAYRFMRWCDRLSLILCQQEIPAGERELEITLGPDNTRYYIIQLGDVLTVKPWPFNESSITVNVEACCLSQIKFDSNEELKTALKTAPRKILEWTFKEK